jgi:glycosyltransferase involved in cell wall biosynthesis
MQANMGATQLAGSINAGESSACRAMNVLVYVHMRNIYRSTGAGRVARQLIEHLAKRQGINIHILADQSDYRSVIDKVGAPWTDYQYHFFTKDTGIQQRQWLILHSPKAESFWPEAQIVHCTGESYVPRSRARLIVTVHDAAYFDASAHPKNWATVKQSLKWRVLYATLSRTASLFHTVSHFSADRLAAVFPDIRSRLRVIHNAAHPRFFGAVSDVGTEFLARHGLSGKPYILVPGGLQYRKNAELVLKAWPILAERFPDFTLIVAGHCDPRLVGAALALGKSVLLTGFVEDDELHALYHGSRVVWFPSRYEGFGMPVLEAMASGAAVVSSNSTSIPEVAGDAALLVDPRSLDDNIGALEAVIRDEQLRASLRGRGKVRAQGFTWGVSAARLQDLYSEVL